MPRRVVELKTMGRWSNEVLFSCVKGEEHLHELMPSSSQDRTLGEKRKVQSFFTWKKERRESKNIYVSSRLCKKKPRSGIQMGSLQGMSGEGVRRMGDGKCKYSDASLSVPFCVVLMFGEAGASTLHPAADNRLLSFLHQLLACPGLRGLPIASLAWLACVPQHLYATLNKLGIILGASNTKAAPKEGLTSVRKVGFPFLTSPETWS